MTEARPICGSCVNCLRATNRMLRVVPPPRKLPGRAPTAAALERHARKFGPEQVRETAAEYGLSVAIERPKAKRGPGGPSLKERIAVLVRDGYGTDVIAEMEDLTPARARRLVAEVGAA